MVIRLTRGVLNSCLVNASWITMHTRVLWVVYWLQNCTIMVRHHSTNRNWKRYEPIRRMVHTVLSMGGTAACTCIFSSTTGTQYNSSALYSHMYYVHGGGNTPLGWETGSLSWTGSWRVMLREWKNWCLADGSILLLPYLYQSWRYGQAK